MCTRKKKKKKRRGLGEESILGAERETRVEKRNGDDVRPIRQKAERKAGERSRGFARTRRKVD
ncbi:hypothetical protein EYF80_058269 [Liparis tanakae]|uniref:Uncharacterized protein n=1 Tax=Liparis tanakae TaxID=230148 RepID=A0A4Z2ETH5_9TELE|nr:hypothetical protein EYF80_058269 [Liparis tanakae]